MSVWLSQNCLGYASSFVFSVGLRMILSINKTKLLGVWLCLHDGNNVSRYAKRKKMYLSCTILRKLFQDLHQQTQREIKEKVVECRKAERPQWYPRSPREHLVYVAARGQGRVSIPGRKWIPCSSRPHNGSWNILKRYWGHITFFENKEKERHLETSGKATTIQEICGQNIKQNLKMAFFKAIGRA